MDHDKQSPPTDQQTDLSKAQNPQQPLGQQDKSQFAQSRQPPQGQAQQQPPEGQAETDSIGDSTGES